MAAEIADLAVGAGESIVGLAGEDALLEELSSERKSADAADEFGEEVSFDFEALRSDLRRDLEGSAEGLTDAFAVVVHFDSFARWFVDTLRSQPSGVRRIFPAFSIAHSVSPRRWLFTRSSSRSRVRGSGRWRSSSEE